ncbi:hypothetical protein ACFC26_40410 [Kitasatospora purpeofusca]
MIRTRLVQAAAVAVLTPAATTAAATTVTPGATVAPVTQDNLTWG